MKQWIRDHCFTNKGTLNNRVCSESWWLHREFDQQLNEVLLRGNTISEGLHCIMNDIEQPPVCVCGNSLEFMQFKSGYREYCSNYCATHSEKRNKKISDVWEDPSAVSSMVAKIKATNLERYGTECFYQTSDFKTKSKLTKLHRYGDKNYSNSKQAVETKRKHGISFATASKIESPPLELLLFLNETHTVHQMAEKLGYCATLVSRWLSDAGIRKKLFTSSMSETEVFDWICEEFPEEEIIQNDRSSAIKPKHIDVYIPNKNVGIEYNGVYWHRDSICRHLDKYNLAKAAGIRLIQIWDYQWETKQDIVKSIIMNSLGAASSIIHARKCEIVHNVDAADYKDFMNSNHIQGAGTIAKERIALKFDDRYVAMIGISKPRFGKDKDDKQELLRFGVLLGTSVVGGLSRLMCARTEPNKICMSYCDNMLFNGNGYEKAGWTKIRTTSPSYFYTGKGGLRVSRYSAQKHKLSVLLGLENFNSDHTEMQNMRDNGYTPVYDAGTTVFEWNKGTK